jgi:hypothetical protein
MTRDLRPFWVAAITAGMVVLIITFLIESGTIALSIAMERHNMFIMKDDAKSATNRMRE